MAPGDRQCDRPRHLVRRFHLWLGLALGGLLVLLGLTGSALVFYPEIDRALHPELHGARTSAPDFDRALATLRSAYPDKQGPWRLEVTGQSGPIPARYYDPPERAAHDFRPMMVWLSPDGARVLRRDYWGEYAVTFLYDLHYRLLLGKRGGEVLGWTGLALLILLLSGLWAWWPRGSLRKAMRIKPKAPPQRSLRDWHKLAGLVGLPLLLLLTATGIMLELPEEGNVALGAIGLPVDPHRHIHPVHAGPHRFTLAQTLSLARTALPGARAAWIETAPASGGHITFRLQVPGDPSHRFPHSFVTVDGASGRVISIEDARDASAGTSFNNWIHPLHDGSAGGLAGRVLAFLAGLVPLALFATGLARWRLRGLRQRGTGRGRAS